MSADLPVPQSHLGGGDPEGRSLLQHIAHEEEAPLPQELLHGNTARSSQWASQALSDDARLRTVTGDRSGYAHVVPSTSITLGVSEHEQADFVSRDTMMFAVASSSARLPQHCRSTTLGWRAAMRPVA